MDRETPWVKLRLPLLALLLLVAGSAFAATTTDYEDYVDNDILGDNEIDEPIASKDIKDNTAEYTPLLCPTTCKYRSSDEQWYEPGFRYNFRYEAVVGSKVWPAKDGPQLRLRAAATIDALTRCQLRLKLSNVSMEVVEVAMSHEGQMLARTSVEGTPRPVANADRLKADLERRPLVFSFANGVIDALCPSADEAPWALNVKRGLLSTLQSSGRSAHERRDVVIERDINGLCLARYSSIREFGSIYTLMKKKELSSCTSRSQVALPLPSGAAPLGKHAKSPLNAHQICVQEFVRNQLQSSRCSEYHTVIPFSTGEGKFGATTSTYVNLEHSGRSRLLNDESAVVPFGPRTSLQYEAEVENGQAEEDDPAAGDAGEILGLLRRLAATTEDPASAEDPQDPAALLKRVAVALRNSDFTTLKLLFTLAEEQPTIRRLLLETLPSARSAPAAALAAHLDATGRISTQEADAWVAARALRAPPSDHELLAFAPLVESTDRPAVLLAAGALVHSRCAAAPLPLEACARGSPADQLLAHVERTLGPRCRHAAADERRALAALRALGNAGYFAPPTRVTLRACYQNVDNPLPLRLAAVDALRRAPCDVTEQQNLLRLFSSPRADSELRIAGYLALIRCASPKTITAVREVLRKEDLGQVTSFVWSHLKNIMTSSSSWKMHLKDFIEDDFLKEKFSVEALKYSRNYETSTYFKSIDTTATVESNVIFSRESYLPRSTSVNLNVEMFGQPFNLLEVGARAEGFEKMLEDFFGPQGYYPEPTVRDMLSTLKGKQEQELAAGLKRLREAYKEGAKLHSEPRAEVFARLFGQEVAFTALHDAPRVLESLQGGDPIAAALAAMFTSGSIDMTKTFLLDDAKYTVPTIIGLPLTLSLGASGLLRVRAHSNWSTEAAVANLAGGGGGAAVRAEASFSPSAALSVDAAMTVALPRSAATVGLRLRQNARASSNAGAAALVRGAKLVHLELHAPKQTLHLLDASSKVVMVMDGEERILNQPTMRTEECTGQIVSRVLGVRACSNITRPEIVSQSSLAHFVPFPLSGPAELKLQVNKTDSFDKYEIQWELETGEQGARGLKVSFDTPGSSADRAVSLEARADASAPSFHLQLRSPAGGAEMSASVARNESAAAADARLAVGGEELLRVVAALRWERPESGPDALRLRPELDAQAAGRAPLRLAGELGLMPGARYHAHVVLRGSGEPVRLQGELRLRDGGYDVLGEVTCPLFNGSLTGNVTAGPGACASDLRVEYTTSKGKQHSASWSHSYLAGANSLAVNASTEASQLPWASARVQWSLRRETALWEHRLRWQRRKDVWKAVQRVRTLRRGPRTHLQALAALACPEGVEYKMDLEHQVQKGNYSTRGEVILGAGQRYVAAVQMSRAPGPHVILNAEAATPSVRAELRGLLHRKKHLQGLLEGVVILPRGRKHKLALTGTYKQEGGVDEADLAGAQVHDVQLNLVGALQADVHGRVALGAAGVEHTLTLRKDARSPASYQHVVQYRAHDERHVFDASLSIYDLKFNTTVETVLSARERSVLVRLPFQSEIILSSKFLYGSHTDSNSQDQESFHMEVSWDKYKKPNNYVSFNTSVEGTYSRHVLDYPNQNIFGEIVNKPGYISSELAWKSRKNKINSEVRWNFDPYKGAVSAWMKTPFDKLEEQNIDVNYTNDGQMFHVAVSTLFLGLQQMAEVAARSGASGNIAASLTLEGAPLPPLQASFEHAPGGNTELTAVTEGTDVLLRVSRGANGAVAAMEGSAAGDLFPFPPCALQYVHEATGRRGELRCEDFFAFRFNASDDRPAAAFDGAFTNFGHARFNFNLSGNNKTAIFETGHKENDRFFAIGLEHYQEDKSNFTLKVDTQWKERTLKTIITYSNTSQQLSFNGSITGDMEMSVIHVKRRFSNFPNHFLTTIFLPGNVLFNHTFQGKDLMNWASTARVRTPSREGVVTLEQSANATAFFHRAAAEAADLRGGPPRSVELHVRVATGEDVLGAVSAIDASLRPPGASDPVALRFRNNDEERALALRYPPAALVLDVDLESVENTYVVKGRLSTPETEPLSMVTHLKLDSSTISLDSTGYWGNSTMDLKMFGFGVRGTTLSNISIIHSSYGEILRVETSNKQVSHFLETIDVLLRFFSKEFKVNIENKLKANGLGGKLTVDVVSPFESWKTVQSTATFDMESEIIELTYNVKRNKDVVNFVCKSDILEKSSMLDMEFASVLLEDSSHKYLEGKFDRRDRTNQVLNWQFSYDNKTAQFEGAVTRRNSQHFEGGGAIHGLLKTWMTGLEHTEILLNFTNEQSRELVLLLRKDDWILRANGSSQFDETNSSAQLDVLLPITVPVRHITGKLNYHMQSLTDHEVVTSVTCDGQVLETNVSLAASEGELAAYLDTRTSMHGYGPLTAKFNLAGTLNTTKKILFEVMNGDKHFNVTGQLAVPSLLRVQGDIGVESTFGTPRQLHAELKYDVSGGGAEGRRHAWLRVRLPEEHWVRAEALAPHQLRIEASLEVQSPLAGSVRAAAHLNGEEAGAVYANATLHVTPPDGSPERVSDRSSEGSPDVSSEVPPVGSSKRSPDGSSNRSPEGSSNGAPEQRQLLHAALSLRNSILTAQMVAPPLGLHALSLSAGWAPREPRRYARLHFHALDHELSAEANTTHDLLVAELMMSCSALGGAPASRLHAKYDVSKAERNVTVVAVRGDDAYTLSTSLTRPAAERGTKVDVYLDVARFGRMRAVAEMLTPKGSILELFIDDGELDHLLHARALVEQKQIELFIETRFEDIRKLNFTGQLDVSPNFKKAGLSLEYMAGKSYLPSLAVARIDLKESYFKINNNNLNLRSVPRDMEAKLNYEKLLHSPSSPAYDLVILVNRTEVFRSFAKLDLDKKNEIGVNLKMNSNLSGKKWKIGVDGRWESKFPGAIDIKITDQMGALMELTGMTIAGGDDGFTYHAALTTSHGKYRRHVQVEYYPEAQLRLSLDTNGTSSGEHTGRYRALLHLEAPRIFRMELETPLPGYESLEVHWRREGDELLLDAHSSFPGFDSLAIEGRASLGPMSKAQFQTTVDGIPFGSGLFLLERGEDLRNASFQLEFTGTGSRRCGVNVWYDVAAAKKSAEISLVGPSDSLTRRIAGFLSTEDGLQVQLSVFLPEHTSALDVMNNKNEFQFMTIFKDHKIAEIKIRRDSLDNGYFAFVNIKSSLMKHPVTIVYSMNSTNPSYLIRHTLVEVSALGQTSKAHFVMTEYSDSVTKRNMIYDLDANIFQTVLKADAKLVHGKMEGKCQLHVHDKELLSLVVKSNSTLSSDGLISFAIVDEKFMFLKVQYDMQRLENKLDMFAQYNGHQVLNSKINLKLNDDQSVEEISADVHAPQTHISRFIFNYTMTHIHVHKRNYKNDKFYLKRSIRVQWNQSTKENLAHMTMEFVGSNKSLRFNIEENNNEIFSFLSDFNSYTTYQYTTKKINVQLRNIDTKWAIHGTSLNNHESISKMNFEIISPREEMKYLLFNYDTSNGFDIDISAETMGKNASLIASCNVDNGFSSSATLITPYFPSTHYNITTTTVENPSFFFFGEHGGSSFSLKLIAFRPNDVLTNLYSSFESSFTLPCIVNATFSYVGEENALIQTYYGSELIAEVKGKMMFTIIPNTLFQISLDGRAGDRFGRLTAIWSNVTEDGEEGRLGWLEWEAENIKVKCRSEINFKGQYDAIVDVRVGEPIVEARIQGSWPKSGQINVSTKERDYEASYTLETDVQSQTATLTITKPISFSAKASLETDLNAMTQKAKMEANGYSTVLTWKSGDIWDLGAEVWTPKRNVFTATGLYTKEEIKCNLMWMNKDIENHLTFNALMKENGYMNWSTPWNIEANIFWSKTPSICISEAKISLDKNELLLQLISNSITKKINMESPWGSILITRDRYSHRQEYSLIVNGPKTTGGNEILRVQMFSHPTLAMKIRLHLDELYALDFLCATTFGTDLDGSRMEINITSPRLNATARVDISTYWELALEVSGPLTPLQLKAFLLRGEHRVRIDVELPSKDGGDVSLHAWLKPHVDRWGAAVGFNLTCPSLELSVDALRGLETALNASVRASGLGSARFNTERKPGAARVSAEMVNAAGTQIGAYGNASWGPNDLRVGVAAGSWSAGVNFGKRPLFLQAHCGNVSLLVRSGQAQLVMADGTNHSVVWKVRRKENRVRMGVEVATPVLLQERASLRLDVGAHSDGKGLDAEVSIESGGHRQAVELYFRGWPRSAFKVLVDVDGNALLRLDSALEVMDELVHASLDIEAWGIKNNVEVSHRRGFPVASWVRARSPLLLGAERVVARLEMDEATLAAEASRGDGANRRAVAFSGAVTNRSVTLGFECSAVAAVGVRSFTLRGELHEVICGFDTHAELALADGSGMNASATAVLGVDAAWGNATFISRSSTKKHIYQTGIFIPLAIKKVTAIVTWLYLPGVEYVFATKLETTDALISAQIVTSSPIFTSVSKVKMQREPEYSLRASLESTITGFTHYAIQLNVLDEASSERVHALEWSSRRIELRHRFELRSAAVAAGVRLSTPFPGHERYAMQVAYENGERKLAVARVLYPGLERDLGLELQYQVRGLMDASLRAAFHAPFLPRLRSATVALTHALEADAAALTYVLALYGEVNGRAASANVSANAAAEESALGVDFAAARDGSDPFWLRLRAASPDGLQRHTCTLELGSPIDALRQLRVVYNKTQNRVYAVAEHNDIRYLETVAVRDGYRYNITCVNPLKTVSLFVSENFLWPTDLGVELGWEEGGVLAPRVGGGVWLFESREGRVVEMGWWARLREMELRCESVRKESPDGWEQGAGARWAERALSYSAVVRRGEGGEWEREMRVQVGERALVARADGAPSRHGALLMWDAARDPAKRVGYTVSIAEEEGLEVKLTHPLLGGGARMGISGHLQAEGGRLRAGAALAFALLTVPGADWRASASLEVAPRRGALSSGGRAFVVLRLEDRQAGRDLSGELDATLGEACAVSAPGCEAALALNVTYVPEAGAARRTLLSEARVGAGRLLLRALTPEGDVSLRARASLESAELLLRADDRDAFRVQVGADVDKRSLGGELELGGAVRYRAMLSAPHRRLVKAGVWEEAADSRGVAPWATPPVAEVVARLRTPRVLEASVTWKLPDGREVREMAVRQLERVSRAAMYAADAHERLWRERWDAQVPWPPRAAWEQFAQQETAAIAGDVVEVVEDIQSRYTQSKAIVVAGVSTLLRDAGEPANTFWNGTVALVHGIADSVLKWTRAVANAATESLMVAVDALGTDSVLAALGDALAEFREQTVVARAAVLERSVALLDEAGQAVVNSAMVSIAAAERVVERVVLPVVNHAWAALAAVTEAMYEPSLWFSELFDTIKAAIVDVKEFREVLVLTEEAALWLRGPFEEYLNELMEKLVEVVDLVLSDLQQSMRLLWEKVQTAPMTLPPSVHQAYREAVQFFRRYFLVLVELLAQRRDMLGRTDVAVMAVRPEEGVVTVVQTLPVDWEGFDRAPRFDQLGRVSAFKIEDAEEEQKSNAVLRLIDSISEMSAETPRKLVQTALARALPNFSATGQLVGGGKVITFDGNAYTLQPDCAYLLAGDLAHDTFAIVVNFASQNFTRRTFTIITPDHNILVNSDYMVKVDGEIVDLPEKPSSFLSIERSEDAVDVAAPGFKFRCHVRHDVCSVHVSGWHFGHVAGLLGSFDRERANDLEVPGVKSEVGEEAAKAWRVGRCRSSNRLPAATRRTSDVSACQKMFEDPSSTLAACRARVDSAPYATVCATEGPCQAAFAYSEACALQTWFKPTVPSECKSCLAPSGAWVPAGASASASAAPQADVVLVVQRGCGGREGLQRVGDAATHVAAALAARGIADARFAVLSFGGAAGVQMHTSGGRAWTHDTRAVQRTLNRLQFLSPAQSPMEAAAGEAEAAVAAAAALVTRAGAGRSVALLQCGACARDAFAQIAAPLTAAGAPLHVLRPGALTTSSGAGAKAARAVGADARGLAFSANRQAGGVGGVESVIVQAVVAKDACTAVALETGGSVFDTTRIGGPHSGTKRFLDTWAEYVARSVRPASCARYTCAADGLALCSAQDFSPQNSEEADEQFMQFLQ